MRLFLEDDELTMRTGAMVLLSMSKNLEICKSLKGVMEAKRAH